MAETPTRRRFSQPGRHGLILGGLAVTSTLATAGCAPDVPVFDDAQFTTVEACSTAGFPTALCQSSYNAAFIEHQRSAPKFATREACEADWGGAQCNETAVQLPGQSSLSSVFVPALAGFVLSRALQQRYYDNGDVDIDYYGGYSGYRGSPIYRNRTGSTVTLGNSGGKMVATPVNVNTKTVAARGFGGSGMSRSGWGG